MRTAAIVAGIAQLLFGIYAAIPQAFGSEITYDHGQLGFEILTFVSSLVLVLFFLAIASAQLLRLRGATRIASLLAGLSLALENRVSLWNTVRFAIGTASFTGMWRYHPLRELAYLFSGTINAFGIATLIAFFLLLFAGSFTARFEGPSVGHRANFLRLISLLATAVSGIWLAVALISITHAPQILERRPASIMLRFVTLSCLAAFFLIFGMNQTARIPVIGRQ